MYLGSNIITAYVLQDVFIGLDAISQEPLEYLHQHFPTNESTNHHHC